MKDLFAVFDESFELIRKLLDEHNFSGCSSIATDLITFSMMSDFTDGVLIGEVLESVFDQIAPLFERFEVVEQERNTLKERLKEQVGLMSKSYRMENKTEVHESLRNIRVAATAFQFKCYRTMKPKSDSDRDRILDRRRY